MRPAGFFAEVLFSPSAQVSDETPNRRLPVAESCCGRAAQFLIKASGSCEAAAPL